MLNKFYTEDFLVAADGAKIRFIDEGKTNTETILFLHGWTSEGKNFAALGRKLVDKYRVVWFDFRGHGKTVSNGPYTMAQLAADARALMDHLELKNVSIMGYSMGAIVLFQYVRDYGCENIKRALILDMTPKILNDEEWQHGLYQGNYFKENYQQDAVLMDKNFYSFISYFFHQALLKHTPEEKRDFKPKLLFNILARLMIRRKRINGLKGFAHELIRSDYCTELSKISVPTAIIYARPGSIYEEGAALYMKSRIPDAQLYPLDNNTHVSIESRTKELAAILEEFSEAM